MEFIHRQHGTLLRLSQSAVTSAGFARYSVQSSQTLKRPSKICFDMTTKHRSSSTNGPSKPPESFPTVDSSLKDKNLPMTMWQKFLAPKPMPERYSASWYGEITLICTVFAITGSTTMYIVRPAVSEGLGIKGSFIEGPWSYRICSIVIMTPLYATLLVGVGTLFGRHAYFRHFAVKIFSRFGIPPDLMDPTYLANKSSFRKW